MQIKTRSALETSKQFSAPRVQHLCRMNSKKLTDMLEQVCPKDGLISFDFDGKLRLHIDLRRFEDMTTLEALLPTVCGGIFHDVQRGMADKHSFFHRLTAVVER